MQFIFILSDEPTTIEWCRLYQLLAAQRDCNICLCARITSIMSPPPTNLPSAYAAPKRDFIGKPAPPGYVAGIGRGATGFTTRSDIGPAREAAASSAGPSTSHSRGGQGTKRGGNDDDDEDEDLNESNYDEFAGYGGSLFSKDPYEEDDEEADRIYAELDRHLDERGKALREAKKRQELEEYRQKRPKIQQQFSDLKSSLKQVSEEEWMSIPDVGDARNRKQRVARQDKFTPVPDSLLAHQAKLASGGEKIVYLDPKSMDVDIEDDDKPGDGIKGDTKPTMPFDEDGTGNLSIGEMSEFRGSYMSMHLSRASNRNTEVQQEDQAPNDYLTNLESKVLNQITDSATVNEYRKQFAALRASDPTFQNAWIASVRLEEAAGKLSKARALISEACHHCPKSADLWLEAIRLHPPDVSKRLIVTALKAVPRSVKLWINAAELENDDDSRRAVYAKARQLVPKSILLWKKSAELEPPAQARVILREAVECCPDAVELWLALARLEPYEEAKQVLVRASEKNPTERSIWITAAKLQEQVGNIKLIESIIKRSIEELSSKGVEIKRNEWFAEAIDADKANFKVTCREIIRRVIGFNVTGDNAAKLNLWLDDVKYFVAEGSLEGARAVFSCITELRDFCKNESVWIKFAQLEAQQRESSKLVDVLRQAVKAENCRRSESIWLMLANAMRANLTECRQILSDALDANPDSEKIVLAAIELECENGSYKEARRILADACMSAKTAQLVMRASKLEWSLGNLDEAVRMLKQGVEEYKNFPEFYISLGQIEEQRGDNEKAKSWYSNGLKFNPTSIQLWISMARLEEKTGYTARARSKLEIARLRNPRNVQLWLEAAQLECRQFVNKSSAGASARPCGTGASRPDIVISLLAKGIRECKDCPDVEKLQEMQADISRRKFVV